MSIKFDRKSMIADLRIQLILSMKELQQELLNEAKQKMLTPEGKEDLTDDEITDIAKVISAGIVGGAWATIDEFGKGSRMDKDNPALEDYKKSNMWNPARKDHYIRTRPNAPGQVDIFGNRVNGIGRGGVNLEELGVVTPQPPSHAIKTAMRWMKNGRMQKLLRNTLAWFPYGKYIITSPK